jgi:glycosyltransferase involved in cell wall biosynthesis
MGEGSLRPAIEGVVLRCGLTSQVQVFTGKNGGKVMAAFDGLVCSSDYEGFPVVFLEAMAGGVPLVTTPVGGARESVLEGQTGFVADGFSEDSLAVAMLKLVAVDQEQRTRMLEEARRHVQHFSRETAAAKTRALYQCIADAKRNRLKSRDEHVVTP